MFRDNSLIIKLVVIKRKKNVKKERKKKKREIVCYFHRSKEPATMSGTKLRKPRGGGVCSREMLNAIDKNKKETRK